MFGLAIFGITNAKRKHTASMIGLSVGNVMELGLSYQRNVGL